MSTQVTTLSAGITSSQTQIPPGWNLNGFFFDAWLRCSQARALTPTRHPVQSGAQTTDNTVLEPMTFSFDIGMTNATPAIRLGQYAGPTTSQKSGAVFAGRPVPLNPGKSVNAVNAIFDLQATRNLLYLVTKYGRYENVVITNVEPNDNPNTLNGAYFTVTLQQLIIASARF